MGSINSSPLVSQVKSVVQLACGDAEGAAQTQEQFVHECPVVSQVTSTVYLATGNTEKAVETQKRCMKAVSNFLDGVPGVGHVKGLVHYAYGDDESGTKSMKSATRTTGVMGAGAVGFIVAGPVGAVLGGIKGGLLMDAGTTFVTGEKSGYVAGIQNVIENPSAGTVFDTLMIPVGDALTGNAGGNIAESIQVDTGGHSDTGLSNVSPPGGHVANEGNLHATLENVIIPSGEERKNNQQYIKLTDKELDSECAARLSECRQECPCSEIKLKAMCINIQSVIPKNKDAIFIDKIKKFKTLVAEENFDIILIVETCLDKSHSNDEVKSLLDLDDYSFFRCDNIYDNENISTERKISRGGIIIAWWKQRARNESYIFNVSSDTNKDYAAYIKNVCINVRYNCSRTCNENLCKSITIIGICRPAISCETIGDEVDEQEKVDTEIIDRLGHLVFDSNTIMVGTFNWKISREYDEMEHVVYGNVASGYSVWPSQNVATHINGKTVDTIISSPFGLTTNHSKSQLNISDHYALLFTVNLGMKPVTT